MIKNCNYSTDHKNCKFQQDCQLRIPYHENLRKVEMKILDIKHEINSIKSNVLLFKNTLQEINDGKYNTSYKIMGCIVEVPKQNALGHHITRPEHVINGLNINVLKLRYDELNEDLSVYRKKELHMIKILKKRGGI